MSAAEEEVTLSQAHLAAESLTPYPALPRAMRYEFKRRQREWRNAIALAEGAGDEDSAIVLVGGLVRGMEVVVASGWGEVQRVMRRDSQVTLHVEDPEDPRPLYLNFYSDSSPVVVRR